MSTDAVIQVEWSEPPPAETRGRSASPEWEAVGETLREYPGDWARVKTYDNGASAKSLAGRIRRGMIKTFEEGGYEAVARHIGENAEGQDEWGVWARYLGENVDPVAVLAGQKQAVLKAIAKDAGLIVGGTNQALAERIVEHFGPDIDVDDVLSEHLPEEE